ncbi:MAG: NADH-quinone oxidoreductase subunit J [Bacteroidetes bacterium]|nr:NADH-quinone oxidoreductase subunit J [Rhodothermia bacterium]MCS7155716.1 NADH-quinone oxidoreductase subunit J [Bacteroidota bacterium]MCX7906570.1 NADH-quinone oxidoreductase subunit J [Bacteroidota bacterium]MDW8137149.1 NADH-quinone oxidoreductase subunit J [Bacteroidota bacterium]MDW8284981.1 NADH-quinone oxidoreductase subunit J [Bacteroidota bacterium]
MQAILFSLFGALAIAGAVGVIAARNPVYSALSLVLNFFSLAGLYLSLEAQFLAVAQVIVYAGAIVVLFLFVIMLLNLQPESLPRLRLDLTGLLALLLGAGLLMGIGAGLWAFARTAFERNPEPSSVGTVDSLGRTLFSTYLVGFELVALLLLVAMIGAVMLAKRRFK